jgi:hypothetical protein
MTVSDLYVCVVKSFNSTIPGCTCQPSSRMVLSRQYAVTKWLSSGMCDFIYCAKIDIHVFYIIMKKWCADAKAPSFSRVSKSPGLVDYEETRLTVYFATFFEFQLSKVRFCYKNSLFFCKFLTVEITKLPFSCEGLIQMNYFQLHNCKQIMTISANLVWIG